MAGRSPPLYLGLYRIITQLASFYRRGEDRTVRIRENRVPSFPPYYSILLACFVASPRRDHQEILIDFVWLAVVIFRIRMNHERTPPMGASPVCRLPSPPLHWSSVLGTVLSSFSTPPHM